MKIFQVTWPRESSYASALRRGTWIDDSLCPRCESPRNKLVPPLVIEWEPGSKDIGDFVWPGYGHEVIVRESVFLAINERFTGVEALGIEMSEDPKANGRPKVELPYSGPALVELSIVGTGTLDRERSSVVQVQDACPTCGTEIFEARGLEEFDATIDLRTGKTTWNKTPRQRGHGLFVHSESDFFRVKELSGRMLCSERVAEYVDQQRLTNIAFLDVGEMI